MYVTGTFTGKRFLQGEPMEFTVSIVPEEMEGKEIESFICFSQQPSSLEVLKGDQWLPCSGILGCSLLVNEETTFRDRGLPGGLSAEQRAGPLPAVLRRGSAYGCRVPPERRKRLHAGGSDPLEKGGFPWIGF